MNRELIFEKKDRYKKYFVRRIKGSKWSEKNKRLM